MRGGLRFVGVVGRGTRFSCPCEVWDAPWPGDISNRPNDTPFSGGFIDADNTTLYLPGRVDSSVLFSMDIFDLGAGSSTWFDHTESLLTVAPSSTSGKVYVSTSLKVGVIEAGSHSQIIDKTGATLGGGFAFDQIVDMIFQPVDGNLYVFYRWQKTSFPAATRSQIVQLTPGGGETVIEDQQVISGTGGTDFPARALAPTLDGGVWWIAQTTDSIGTTTYEVWRTGGLQVEIPQVINETVPAIDGSGILVASNTGLSVHLIYWVKADGSTETVENLCPGTRTAMRSGFWSPSQETLMSDLRSVGNPELWDWRCE